MRAQCGCFVRLGFHGNDEIVEELTEIPRSADPDPAAYMVNLIEWPQPPLLDVMVGSIHPGQSGPFESH